MVDKILGPINPIQPKVSTPEATTTPKTGGPSFRDMLQKAMSDVSELQEIKGEKINQLATGEIEDLHQVMIAMEEAGIAFQFTMEIRNKIIEAYQEIMRMQV
jgi:flagellar hook-basal body complex protein FliE